MTMVSGSIVLKYVAVLTIHANMHNPNTLIAQSILRRYGFIITIKHPKVTTVISAIHMLTYLIQCRICIRPGYYMKWVNPLDPGKMRLV